jgi:hypothetical protein
MRGPTLDPRDERQGLILERGAGVISTPMSYSISAQQSFPFSDLVCTLVHKGTSYEEIDDECFKHGPCSLDSL